MAIDINKLNKITAHFGKYPQVIKLGEEVGELFKAILNYEMGYTRTTNEITEEFADVKLVLAEIQEMFALDEKEVQIIMEMKLDRTIDKYSIE